MDMAWCDQAEIIESITAQGRPRGCHKWALVRPGRDYGVYCHSGHPRGCHEWALRQILWNLSPLRGAREAETVESIVTQGCYGWVWPGATRQIAESITTQPYPYTAGQIEPFRCYRLLVPICHMRSSNELQHLKPPLTTVTRLSGWHRLHLLT